MQPNYIPWKGYFDLINLVDEFILLDDVQYTRRDWRNRNKIKTPRGPIWLTIPVNAKGHYLEIIKNITVEDPAWPREHWQTIVTHYSKAAHFREWRELLEELYLSTNERYLSEINRRFLGTLCASLGIATVITSSSDYDAPGTKTERLIALCRRSGATGYLSGPSAAGYLDEGAFSDAGLELRYVDYAGYPEYEQLYPPFDHFVSVVDLIMNQGTAAPNYMKSFASRQHAA